MITPRNLLDLANDLCDDDREEAWRTAASCAYYAVFHTARQLLEEAGFEVPHAEQAHAYLWLRLQNSGHPDIRAAGSELSDLRSRRNQGQYDLNVPFPHRHATEQVHVALRAIDLLESAVVSPDTLKRITDVIRIYERDVLRVVSYRATP